jgi:hypothetical protein
MKIHQHISRLPASAAQGLLAEEVPLMAVVVAVAPVVRVLHAAMELHQLQQHLQAVLA